MPFREIKYGLCKGLLQTFEFKDLSIHRNPSHNKQTYVAEMILITGSWEQRQQQATPKKDRMCPVGFETFYLSWVEYKSTKPPEEDADLDNELGVSLIIDPLATLQKLHPMPTSKPTMPDSAKLFPRTGHHPKI